MRLKEKEKGVWFYLALIPILTIILLNRIIFTDQIINATDVVTQYYWSVVGTAHMSSLDWLDYTWYGAANFGNEVTRVIARGLLPYRILIYNIFPPYQGIAWEAVLHIIFAGIGTFLYCRTIGLRSFSSFLAAASFIFSAEIITLINAGHIGKINTISWLPLVLFFLEKGLQERRAYYFFLTGGALALQFFEMHWQISFYTCLAVGFYFIFRTTELAIKERKPKEFGKLYLLGTLMVIVFFSAAMVSFLPTYDWSKTTERAGGMRYEEGMSWSMPPEEIVTYVIPEFFGLSRKEKVSDPGYIDVFYWGKMGFTQTTRYMGVLPLILAAIAIIYRRNVYTWLFASLAITVLFMGMGKYTPVYRFMYSYLPGFSTFRVPQMILFIFPFSVSVLAGLGVEWLLYDEEANKAKRIKKVIYCLIGFLLFSSLLTLYAWIDKDLIFGTFKSLINRPSRYINDPDLPQTRYLNILQGAGCFLAILSLSIGLFLVVLKEKVKTTILLGGITLLLILDVWRINYKFISTWEVPNTTASENINFLKKDKELYRILPLSGTGAEFYYTYFDIPVLFGYSPVVDQRFAEIRSRFRLDSKLADILNVKYLLIPKKQFGGGKVVPPLGYTIMGKYKVVYNDDPNTVVFLNTRYLPRAWPVHSVTVQEGRDKILSLLNNKQFNPREMVLLEEPPPPYLVSSPGSSAASHVRIAEFTSNKIVIEADMSGNGFIVLSELYHEEWKAYVDGKESKIYPANYVMRAVFLPKGKHTVKFVFDPWPFNVGLWISSITFLFIAGCIVWRVRKNRTFQPVQTEAVRNNQRKKKKKRNT